MSAIKLLAFSMVFLISSSEVLYMLQSEARRSIPLLLFLTARNPILSPPPKHAKGNECVQIAGSQEREQE